MADSKRNSIAGKVATPRAGASSPAGPSNMVNPLETLAKAIGARIKITTVAPWSETHEGTIFTADPDLNVVAVNTRPPPAHLSASEAAAQPSNFCVINISQIQSFHIVSMPEHTSDAGGGLANAFPSIGAVDLQAARLRVDARVKQLKEEERNRGKGVTREAQAIYDSFKRINMPIRWHNQEMIVHEAVIIAPPYRVEDCKGPKDKQDALNRVRKVLEGERRKLREKDERERRAGGIDAATSTAPVRGISGAATVASLVSTGPRKGG